MKLIRATLLILAISFLSETLQAQSQAKGFVYHDANGNGLRDRKEAGIPGVAVSNGRQVVVTDEKGQYFLPVGEDNIISVIKPAGYQVRINGDNQPQYYYIHKPKGSPELKFRGVAPTGPLPASIDFALTPREESDDFTALVFGDPQPYNEDEMDYFARGVVKEVENVENVQFGISLGDIVGDDLSLQKPYIQTIKKAGIPWYNLMGNHDKNYDAAADSLADETFESNFGPANYAFNHGKVHFIVLDNIRYPDPRDGQGYWGGFRPDQFDFIANDLKYVSKDKLIVIAFHIPLFGVGTAFREEDRQKLFDLLKEYPNILAMSAHTHVQRQHFYTANDGWQGAKPFHEFNSGTPSGNWYSGEFTDKGVPAGTMSDGTPRGYSFLRIKGNQYIIDYKVAEMPESHQMRIYAPRVVPADGRRSGGAVFANFYMGYQDSQVQFRIDNGEWKNMSYTVEPDPYYLHLHHRWDHAESLMAGRRPGAASQCSHLWKAGLPGNLTEGQHAIEVRAVDMFGRTFTEKKFFWAEKR